MIRKRKALYFLSTVVVLILAGFYIYAFKLPYFVLDEKERTRVVDSIKSSHQLPERFYEIYNIVYPNSLEQNQLQYLIAKEFSNSNERRECPCRLASYGSEWTSSLRLNLPQKTFFVESFATQRKCLNYYASKIVFDKNTKGIEEASIMLFNKQLVELDDDELIEIILIMSNPSFFNKDRYPDRLKSAVESYKKLI